VNNLTSQQQAIVFFWADAPGATATPAGHSISILTQVLREHGAPLDRAAEAYARVGMAVADAFISCWSCKYRYNLLRPVTYIQRLIDPRWLPVLPTPPFPEYTSGHSVQAAAAALVLADLFGARAFTDRTHTDRGFAPRPFASFFQAAEEAAISRLYGGIHFRPAIERGLEQGRCIGRKVGSLRFRT
jgi:membrane-associated phospholipid phosphatase